MYNIKFNSYIPEPNPAKSDRIVAAHYYPAWKKDAAGLHEGFNDLAQNYPDRTPLMGYYDEENPEVCDWEIKWAVEHGINCFTKENYLVIDNKPVVFTYSFRRLEDECFKNAESQRKTFDACREYAKKFGYKYLQAIREELTKRNNLPDYITPRDQGFGDYNKSWKTPDFAKVCSEKIK